MKQKPPVACHPELALLRLGRGSGSQYLSTRLVLYRDSVRQLADQNDMFLLVLNSPLILKSKA